MRISTPIPDVNLKAAARMWRRRFAPFGASLPAPKIRACHGVVAIDGTGAVSGIMGLRDETGGLFEARRSVSGWLYRPAPATDDLVVDGIITRDRRKGTGRALIGEGMSRARASGRPGLRVEVQIRNREALRFYDALGFVEVTRGRFGWPWSGCVVVMRRAA